MLSLTDLITYSVSNVFCFCFFLNEKELSTRKAFVGNALWQKHREPLYVLFNLKVTKEFGRWMKLALFIDRMLDYMPDYKTNSGLIVRRTAKPYFGMEINFSI